MTNQRQNGGRPDDPNAYDPNDWNIWSLGQAAYPPASHDSGSANTPSGAETSAGADGSSDSLVTERDIDPGFGMFEDEPAGSRVTSAEDRLLAMYPDNALPEGGEAEAGVFPDVPDADAVAADSPVDPASPPDQYHGTDLLNGVGLHPEEETEA